MDDSPPSAPSPRRRLSLRAELALALTATIPVLLVFAALEYLSRQHILYASIAASALAIYVDPFHRSNQPRTILQAQSLATLIGLSTDLLLGHTYLAAGSALVLTVLLCVTLNRLHPPAVATALAFAFRTGEIRTLLIFAIAVGITIALVGLERAMLWMLRRMAKSSPSPIPPTFPDRLPPFS